MNSRNAEAKNLLSTLISPAFAVPVMTAGGYLGSYSFEVAYLRTFGIDLQSAKVETNSLVFFAFILTIFLGTVLAMAFPIVVDSPQYYSKIKRRIYFKYILPPIAIILLVAFFFLSSSTFRLILGMFLGVLLPFALTMIFTIFENIFTKMKKWKKFKIIAFVGMNVLMFIVLSFFAGYIYGKAQTTFKRVGNYIVIREYSQSTIMAEVSEGRTLTGKYKYIQKLVDVEFINDRGYKF